MAAVMVVGVMVAVGSAAADWAAAVTVAAMVAVG